MSLLQFARILWARRAIILVATIACFLAALFAIWLLPTRYEAKSRVMMEIVKPDPVTGQAMATNFARAYTKTQIELIRDYRVTGPVVDALGWTSSPALLAQFNASHPGGGDVDFRRWLSQIIANNTKANAIEGSNILEIAYSGNTAESARVTADAVRAAYVDQSLAFKREAAGHSAKWFDGQVAKVGRELQAAEARKTAFERTNKIVLQDDNADTESTKLRALASQVPVSGGTTVTGGESPAALQLAQLDARIAAAAATLGPNHPELQNLRQQRAAIASAARSSGGTTVVSGGPSLAGQVAAAESRVISQRGKVEEARRLAADVTALRDQYAKTAARAVDFRQQAESDDAGLTLLGSAIAPDSPSFPKVPLILGGALFAGIALGVMIALITELLSRRVRGIEDLTSAGVPVLIVVQGWKPHGQDRSLMQRLRLRGPEPA